MSQLIWGLKEIVFLNKKTDKRKPIAFGNFGKFRR